MGCAPAAGPLKWGARVQMVSKIHQNGGLGGPLDTLGGPLGDPWGTLGGPWGTLGGSFGRRVLFLMIFGHFSGKIWVTFGDQNGVKN